MIAVHQQGIALLKSIFKDDLVHFVPLLYLLSQAVTGIDVIQVMINLKIGGLNHLEIQLLVVDFIPSEILRCCAYR
jgi:hypothetical protein